MPGTADPDALLALAMTLADEAVALVAGRIDGDRSAVATKSSPTDLVTAVDRDVEQLLLERLRAARPDDTVVGEEGAAHDGTSGVRWLLDPIDGTTNFVYGFPAFAVSIGAALDGEAVVGVVADLARGERYSAARGRGAHRDGLPIRVSAQAELASALVGTGFGYAPAARAAQARVLTHVLPRVRDIRRAGSAALDLCAVACGRLDAYYEEGVKPWDTAAGELIVREAGGRIGRVDPETGGGAIVAAGPALFEPLRALLREAANGRSPS
jgi:fructose-1,6-bisphosphatase/inositol monophosphatase family enzyme